MNPYQILVEKSDQSLNDAELLYHNNSPNTCVSRSYYAIYYLMQALLLSLNVTPHTHQGILHEFSKHFIKTGIFPLEYCKIIKRELEKRIIGDYEIGHGIDSEMAHKILEDAK